MHIKISLTILSMIVGIATTGLVTMTTMTTQAFADNDKQDKCASARIGETTATGCSTNDESQEILDEFKDSCKEGTFGDEIECSSSQTGYGVFGNFCKQGEIDEESGGGEC